MSQERPDALLKSALEKIVYFEARAAQLTNDLSTACAERERLRSDLAQASQREIELRRVVAELEVRATRAHAEREESANLAEALRRERAELLGKILEASKLNHADGHDPFNLASFISELRSEVLLRRERDEAVGTPVVNAAEAPAPVAAVEAEPSFIAKEAESLKAQGRLTVSKDELASLERAFPFPGRSEETLFGFSVRELTAPDPSARARAAERLTALAHPAAAPALATALHAETDAPVKVALLTALSTLAKVEAIPVIVPQLSSPAAEVRIAALKALLKLDPTQAGPHLAAAVKDPDPAVRRRASLLALALRGPAALELGETAIRDENPDVRSLAALVLGASGMESARPWLMQAMRDPELRVRRSASQALSRQLGQDVSQLVELDEAQRRREVRRLAQVPSNPVKAKVVAALPKATPVAPSAHHANAVEAVAQRAHIETAQRPHQVVGRAHHATAVDGTATVAQQQPQVAIDAATIAPRPHVAAVVQPSSVVEQVVLSHRATPALHHESALHTGAAASRVAVAVLEHTTPAVDGTVIKGVLLELRAAIRGQPADVLATSLNTSLESVRAACAALMEQGQVVRRGHKYFVA
ncbi:MAG: HEAT repeat domain-containing protein [Archangium sp.]|nr:HEAT repeat domain-containing protein [Archangium sp.]